MLHIDAINVVGRNKDKNYYEVGFVHETEQETQKLLSYVFEKTTTFRKLNTYPPISNARV